MGKKTIEEYREEVANRHFETHNEYRNRTGKVSRYVHLKNRDVPHWVRVREVKEYKEASLRAEAKIAAEVARIKSEQPTFVEKQIAYDEARGAYRSRTFLEGVLKMKGVEPHESTEGMFEQYEAWKEARRIEVEKEAERIELEAMQKQMQTPVPDFTGQTQESLELHDEEDEELDALQQFSIMEEE